MESTDAEGEVDFVEVPFRGGASEPVCYALENKDYVDTGLATLFTGNLNVKLENGGRVNP